jgi:hypothetical protein
MAKLLRNLILAAAALLAATLFAQTPADPAEVSLNFTVFAFPDQPTDIRFATGRAASGLLEFLPTARSPHYHYKGAPHLVFFREKSEPGAPGQPPCVVREQVGEVDVPVGMHEPLFVFFPLKAKAQPGREYTIQVFDDSLAHLPLSHLVVFNSSNFDLESTIGGKKLTLGQGPSAAFRAGGSIKVSCAIGYNGKHYSAYDNPVECSAEERVILFLFPSLRPGSPTLQYVYLRDYREPPPKTKAGTR